MKLSMTQVVFIFGFLLNVMDELTMVDKMR